MIYYKVVRLFYNKLHSFNTINFRNPLDVIYTPGFWASADCFLGSNYGLTVFDNKNTAFDFLEYHCRKTKSHDLQIWSCIGKHRMLLPRRYEVLNYCGSTEVFPNIYTSDWPSGTLMFEHVMLLKRIF